MSTNGVVKPLVCKLAEVMAAVHHVPKRGRNAHFGYDFATEADIVALVRKELAERQVMLIPEVTGYRVQDLQPNKDGKAREPLTILDMTFTFVDGESAEKITAPWVGVGQDGGDKGAYKAMTGAAKYFLLKTFLIPTGDDPERDQVSRPTRQRVTVEPPEKVIDAKTGEEVPASKHPEPPAGYRYIDEYILNAPWHELRFHHYYGGEGTLTVSTKMERIGAVAAEAFQAGVPVKIDFTPKKGDKRAGYLNKIETWKPEQDSSAVPPLLASEIPF